MPKVKVKQKLISKAGKSKTIGKEKPVGLVTHFYGNLSVAVVKWKKPIKIGVCVRFVGATTDFSQELESMQSNHKDIKSAKRGQAVGVKVQDKVRAGDLVFSA